MTNLRTAKILCLGAITAALMSAPASAEDTAQEARNKQLALDMWQGVIVDSSPEAVLRYIAPDYIQHNPLLNQGRDALYEAVKANAENKRKHPDAPPHTSSRLIHAFADGDLVVLTWNQDAPEPGDPTKTYVTGGFDMFRFKDGMIVEHWDAVRKPH